jgi:hypothetical protein
MIYYKIKFNNDYPVSEGYMEVDDSAGQMSRLTDLDGNTVQTEGLTFGYSVVDTNPEIPSWLI